MHFNLAHATDILSRTPVILRSMLENIPPEWVSCSEGDQTWSPFDVVGHLIHGEKTDWIPRAKIILQYGESRPFDPFDRFAQLEASKGKSLDELLRTFEQLRSENISALSTMKITGEVLHRKGRHPELGVVSLEELLATWVAHDLDHLVQISRTMARQYQEAVGPWRKYLSVMK